MNNRDSLGDRMKECYENVTRAFVPRKTNVIVRVDGRAFHTFTRGFQKPYDQRVINAMVSSAKAVSKQMSGFKLAYIQSDEASFLINDLGDIDSQMWFDGNIQKIATITASCMSVAFNTHFTDWDMRTSTSAVFDARVFTIPLPDEVVNYFLWRARDWERNSVAMLAQSLFSHKQLNGKNIQQQKEMIESKGKSWDNCTDQEKYGTYIGLGSLDAYYIKSTFRDLKMFMEDKIVPHFEKDGRKSNV